MAQGLALSVAGRSICWLTFGICQDSKLNTCLCSTLPSYCLFPQAMHSHASHAAAACRLKCVATLFLQPAYNLESARVNHQFTPEGERQGLHKAHSPTWLQLAVCHAAMSDSAAPTPKSAPALQQAKAGSSSVTLGQEEAQEDGCGKRSRRKRGAFKSSVHRTGDGHRTWAACTGPRRGQGGVA